MNIIDLSTQIGNIRFDNCLMNASGALCMTEVELNALAHSSAGSWVTKSCTIEKREGNPLPRYYDLNLGSINSMGLPNLGYEFYLNYALEHQTEISNHFLSVAGLTLEENLYILKKIHQSAFNGLVELNLSCPNIPGKPQTGYDFERTKQVLDAVFSFYDKPIGVKLPPYFDMVHFEDMANILNQYPLQFVTCINSVGNALVVDYKTETVVIKPKDGFGGLGGDYVKPTALANVKMFRNLLKSDIKIIGCGGVKTGVDVFEHILCGASMVQVGTQLMKEGITVFDRLIMELKALMIEKNYTNLGNFHNQLQSIS